jgi:hypothetical protein
MVYSLFCLIIIDTKFYNEVITFYVPFKGYVTEKRQDIIDYYDIPFYLICAIHFLLYWKKYTFNAKVYFSSVVVYLLFKILDSYILFNFKSFIFYNILILVILPVTIILDKNRNR